MAATKSTFQSLSACRSSPRTRSGALPQPNSSLRTRSGALPQPNSSLRTRSGAVPHPNSSTPRTCSKSVPELNVSPETEEIPPTPLSFKAITPVVGTLKSVSLSDWWLTKKTKENALGVTGFESKSGSEVRLFSSGAISTRHDSTTLETSDGITVCVSGFINRSRTLQNGFSSEVCNRFLLGFPYHWRDYNEEGFVEEEKKHFTVLFDDIPVNRLQDVLFTSSPCLKSKILDDVVDSLRDLVCPRTVKSDKKCEKSDKRCEKSRTVDESLVPSVVGVKTRGMLRRREENETTIGERVHLTSKKKRSRENNKGDKFLLK